MNLLATVRRIRACEGEAAAQLALEHAIATARREQHEADVATLDDARMPLAADYLRSRGPK